MGRRKPKKSSGKIAKAAKVVAGAALVGGAALGISKVVKSIRGRGGGAGGRRRKGPNWWANRVLVEKLKRRYFKLKYGSAGR